MGGGKDPGGVGDSRSGKNWPQCPTGLLGRGMLFGVAHTSLSLNYLKGLILEILGGEDPRQLPT